MKKLTTLLSAAALATAAGTATVAQETPVSDPFVTTQNTNTGLGLTAVGTIVITTVIIAAVIGLSDSSSSTTTTN